MHKALTVAIIVVMLFGSLTLLPAPARATETRAVTHELLDASAIETIDEYNKYIRYTYGIIDIHQSGRIYFKDTSGNNLAYVCHLIVEEETQVGFDKTTIVYDDTYAIAQLQFENETGAYSDVLTITLYAYTDGVLLNFSITHATNIRVVQIFTIITSAATTYGFDYSTMSEKVLDLSTPIIENIPAFSVENSNSAFYIYQQHKEFFLPSFHSNIYKFDAADCSCAGLPVSTLSFSFFIRPDSPSKKISDVVPMPYPHAYARDASFTMSFDDVEEQVGSDMVVLQKAFNSRNIYIGFFGWWKYDVNGTTVAFYHNQTYVNEIKSVMNTGNIFGLHSPTPWDDGVQNYTDAFADFKYYLGSDALLMQQYHAPNQENFFFSHNYTTKSIVAQNVEFDGCYYTSGEGNFNSRYEVETFYGQTTPAELNNVYYFHRFALFGTGTPDYRKTPVPSLSTNATSYSDVERFMHDLMTKHGAVHGYSHSSDNPFYEPNLTGYPMKTWVNGTVNPIVKYWLDMMVANHSKIWTPNPYTFEVYQLVREMLYLDLVNDTLVVQNPMQYNVDGVSVIIPSEYRSAYINGKEVPVVQKDGFNVVVFSIDAGQTLYIKLSENAPTYELLSANIGEQHVNMYRDGNKIVIKVAGHGTGHLKLKVPFANPSVIASDIYLNIASTSKVIDLDIQAGHTYEIYNQLTQAINISIDWTYAIVNAMIPIAIFAVLLSALTQILQAVRKSVRFRK